jgi:YVTN family beta-propeller protein
LAIAPTAHAQQVVATVPTTPEPIAVAVNPTTNKIYVANTENTGVVTVIDGATNTTSAVQVGMNPDGIAVNPVTNKIYVANANDSTVTVIDGATSATTTVPVGPNPGTIAVNPTTNKIYVIAINNAEAQNASVTVIDGATNTPTNNVAPNINPGFRGIGAGAIAIDEGTNKIFVNDFNNDDVVEIDGATNAVVTAIPASDPTGIAVNPATHLVYITNGPDGTVSVFNETTGTVPTVQIGSRLVGVAVNSVTDKIYALDTGIQTVEVIDGATNAVSSIPIGGESSAIAVNSVTNQVYVANSTAQGTVTVINGATTATSTLPVGSNPFAVAVNPTTNDAYVVNNDASGTVTVVNGSASQAPMITVEPHSQTVEAGAPVAFSISGNESPLAYQWFLNGVALTDGGGFSGSTGATLFISRGVGASDSGAYTCTVTNSAGSATSSAATLTVATSLTPGRLINISTSAYVASGSDILIAGFTVRGTGSKTMILRGIGPTLSNTFNESGTLLDPALSLFDSANPAKLITKDAGWQNPPSAPGGIWSGQAMPTDPTESDFAQVGAFSLAPGSADSAVKVTLPAGGYTSQIASAGNNAGVALAEVYDDDSEASPTEIINISARAYVPPPAIPFNVVIAGFVIEGSTSETVLIRVSGPALSEFGVQGTLSDPKVTLYDNSRNIIAMDQGWKGSPQITSAASSVGAFAWTKSSSADSAILITLPPGAYTAQAASVAGNGGVVLVEVYSVK